MVWDESKTIKRVRSKLVAVCKKSCKWCILRVIMLIRRQFEWFIWRPSNFCRKIVRRPCWLFIPSIEGNYPAVNHCLFSPRSPRFKCIIFRVKYRRTCEFSRWSMKRHLRDSFAIISAPNPHLSVGRGARALNGGFKIIFRGGSADGGGRDIEMGEWTRSIKISWLILARHAIRFV